MDKLIKWLENSFAPKLQKITNLTWIVVIKDSMMQLLPFILAGSIFCVGTILNDYIPALPSFWTPFGWTMSKIGLMASFLIPFNYCEKKRFRKQRILAGFTGMMLFMICIDPQSAEEMGQGHSLYGANGMFVAIFTGIIVGLVFGAFAKFSFFKEDSVIPDFVRQWFDSLLPIMLLIAGGWLIVQVRRCRCCRCCAGRLYAVAECFDLSCRLRVLLLPEVLHLLHGYLHLGAYPC